MCRLLTEDLPVSQHRTTLEKSETRFGAKDRDRLGSAKTGRVNPRQKPLSCYCLGRSVRLGSAADEP